MSTQASSLLQEILALPAADRAEILEQIWNSLDASLPGPTPEVERAAIQEALRRDAELSLDPSIGRTHEQGMAAARKALEDDSLRWNRGGSGPSA